MDRRSVTSCEQDGGAVTALVVQGGGMRGIYSMAVLAEIDRLGWTDRFDHVIGTSAGAINGAYFLAGQAATSVSIYTDVLADSPFIDRRRFWKVVAVDLLMEDLLPRHHPLDERRLRDRGVPLHVGLTREKTAEVEFVRSDEEHVDLWRALHGSSALPVLYNRAVELNGSRYLDGGLVNPVPIDRALEVGATRILVVLTQPADFEAEPPSSWVRWAIRPFVWTQSEAIREVLTHGTDRRDMQLAELREIDNTSAIEIAVLAPSRPGEMVHRLTTDVHRLRRTAELARFDVGATRDRIRELVRVS